MEDFSTSLRYGRNNNFKNVLWSKSLVVHLIRPYPLFHQIRGQKAVFSERGTPVGYGVVCYLHDCRHF